MSTALSPTQLALALFDEFSPIGRKVTEAPEQLGFLRPSAFLDVSNLSLLGRRAVDVTHFLVADDPVTRETYDVDLGLFKWLMGYNSDNRKHLKQSLRDAQKSAIQIEVPNDAEGGPFDGSVPLLADYLLSGNRLYFSMSPRLQRLLKSPAGKAYFFSMRYVFESLYGKILYDRLQRFMHEEWTPWLPLETVKDWLECTGKKTYDDYSKFKQKALDVGVRAINEVTNLQVTYQTKNAAGSRRVESLRFRMELKGTVPDTTTEMLVLRELYDTLRQEFALNNTNLAEILANRDAWTDDYILEAIEYTRFQIRRGQVKRSAGGYLMKALREGYRLGTADLLIEQQINAKALPPPDADTKSTGGDAKKAVADAFTGETADQLERRARHLAKTTDAARQRLEQECAIGHKGFELIESTAERAEVLRAFAVSLPALMVAKRLKLDLTDLTEEQMRNEKALYAAFGAYMFSTLTAASKARAA